MTSDLLTVSIGPRFGMLRAKSPEAWYERGLALEDSAPDQAITAYRRALLGRADLADAHCNLGRLLHDRGELALAESHYRLALACDSQVALYWFNLGVVVEDRGQREQAIETYQHALAIDPGLVDAHFNLARLYEQIGKTCRDELMLRRAIRHLTDYRRLSSSSAAH